MTKGKKYTTYAMCCFGVLALIGFIRFARVANAYSLSYWSFQEWMRNLIVPIGFVVALGLKNKKVAVSVAAGLYCVEEVIPLSEYGEYGIGVGDLLPLLVPFTLLFILLYAILSNKYIRKIWFLPAVSVLLLLFVMWPYGYPMSYFFSEYGPWFEYIKLYFRMILIMVGFLLIGLWLKEDTAPVQRRFTWPTETVLSAQKKTDGVAELVVYKELLDKGGITQEEYDSIKKKIMGL